MCLSYSYSCLWPVLLMSLRMLLLGENIGDVTAKGECVGNIADVLGTGMSIMIAKRNPSLVTTFALLSRGYVFSSYQEVKAVVLHTLNRARFTVAVDSFLKTGEFTCQNAVMAEHFIEAGSAYVLKLEKADVYRLPYLSSSGPGFALLEATKRTNFRDISSQIADGFASGRESKLLSRNLYLGRELVREPMHPLKLRRNRHVLPRQPRSKLRKLELTGKRQVRIVHQY
ncbi:hypothetical protein POM88_037211 [Heracleum sosnowskyi]|uniref:Protein root UVB sensitive/RUS domain-containing protein n=1 Tax=Heracleum sosnowskyi TaxID=360622 RepID=A0AAD8MFQ7_9APIA|nr:hypothetical protein POM88_037211 [Heracleum sosnowskyi]